VSSRRPSKAEQLRPAREALAFDRALRVARTELRADSNSWPICQCKLTLLTSREVSKLVSKSVRSSSNEVERSSTMKRLSLGRYAYETRASATRPSPIAVSLSSQRVVTETRGRTSARGRSRS
jgi:hypothetical protein